MNLTLGLLGFALAVAYWLEWIAIGSSPRWILLYVAVPALRRQPWASTPSC